ncbi:MAG: DNA mismatch repair protein MutS [Planctomycetota bacterium]|nr:DNA mismatch repair protein MutS [Planctomycetota bacterium]
MMKQYEEAKSACGDALLFFRMGDFYELFQQDAQDAAQLLGLTLTSRDKGENPIPMAGFPHHQLENYLGKLIRMGRRVAICEQVEDPKKAVGLVKREITRVVTPGTVTDDGLLDPRESNFLLAIVRTSEPKNNRSEFALTTDHRLPVGLAWVDLSTGSFQAATVPEARLADEVARVAPVELLLPDSLQLPKAMHPATVTRRPDWTFSPKLAQERLTQQFGTQTLEGFGFTSEDHLAVRAAGALLEYLRDTQRTALHHIDRIIPYRSGSSLEIDDSSRRSLEILRTLHDGQREGSLLSVLDCTVTAMGSRLLSQWLASPLTDAAAINARLDAVDEFIRQAGTSEKIRRSLRETYDLQRLLARVATGRASPRDLAFIGQTLQRLPELCHSLGTCQAPLLRRLQAEIDLCPEIAAELTAALADECPLTLQDGGIIRPGHDPLLDELRELAAGGKRWIAEYQARQVRDSGIPNLKIGFNKVFGYYIEISNSQRDRVPAHFIRRQTLKNAERFVTEELKEYEEKVLVADQQAKDREYELFVALRDRVQAATGRMQHTALMLAQLDVLAGFADVARRRNYCRPEPLSESLVDIRDGRHPVLDLREADGTFVPNDTQMHSPHSQFLLITGPNMAGKHTDIRQVELLTLMMQVGSFVPARAARIGIADRIFARVGAGDRLAFGQSTFMVEMTEAARILNGATQSSLVILDEIGRGTSTYDGVSLAWAIVEYLHNQIGCRTLFATHYHELTDLEQTLAGVTNLNVLVKEWEESIAFLHKIVPGAADKSYGIHVARLAGVPRSVQARAQEILVQLEEAHAHQNQNSDRVANEAGADTNAPDGFRRNDEAAPHHPPSPHLRLKRRPQVGRSSDLQLTLFAPYDHPLLDELRMLDLSSMRAEEAVKKIEVWQQQLQDERQQSRLRQ